MFVSIPNEISFFVHKNNIEDIQYLWQENTISCDKKSHLKKIVENALKMTVSDSICTFQLLGWHTEAA